ncbi:MAG: class I adenylate-forming enzyme family protein [Thermoanaerobaculia bacterium]|nr:class I adenylate-forming enzyme family protein [Thermoanaerobaculia bacterium]
MNQRFLMSVATETGIPSTIFRTFERLAALDPEAPAVFDHGRAVTRRELLQSAVEISGRLQEAGLIEGQALAVQMRNSTELLATIAASFQLRLTILSIDRDAKPQELGTVVSQFGARAFVRHGEGPEVSIQPTGEQPSIAYRGALIKLTSGSTGRPRGVLTTENNLIADCVNICTTMGIAPDDVNLGAIPFSHSYGFSNLVTPLLLQGTAVVASNDYMPLSLMELANRHGATVFPGIPMIYDHLSRVPSEDGTFRSVRTLISAGAPLSPAIAKAFRELHGLSIHSFYGCSECGGITYDRLGGAAERGTVGAPMKNVRVRVNPENDRLMVESDAVALGYIDGTEEEQARFEPGRFLTDDLVEWTDDGEVRIRGRATALINIAGKKVNPREVENVILEMEGVREVAVFGAPGGARGEIVAAAVVADESVSRQAIREHCTTVLSTHKVPRIVKLLDELPVDERGKVRKSELL